jgi:outer membrane protein OmpA-like peptidoglycan-associated protein
VKNYLVSKGVNPDILITEGRGEKTLNIQNVTLLLNVQNGKTKPTEEFISKRLNNFNLSI